MRIQTFAVSFMLVWTVLSILIYPAQTLIQYMSTELLQLRYHGNHQLSPPPDLLRFPDIACLPHRRYIHRGSGRNVHIDDSTTIHSIWSSTRRPPRRTTRRRTVDHSALARLARSANANAAFSNQQSDVRFGLFNIRSLNGKGQLLQDLLLDHKYDFLCLTETWQHPDDFSQLNESTPPGFVYSCQPRLTGRGGGLAILHGETWKVSAVSVPVSHSFESVAIQLNGPTPTVLINISRGAHQNQTRISLMNSLHSSLTSAHYHPMLFW